MIGIIDPHWEVVDLDPVTWRRLGRFFDPGQYLRAAQPGEHGLFVLHEEGKLLRVVDSQSGTRLDLLAASIDDPQAVAQALYERGEWQRVHVIDRGHLEMVARVAQEAPRRELTLDAYYHLVNDLLWSNASGYVSLPPRPATWQGWTYADICQTVSSLPSTPSCLALGVCEESRWQIGLILVFAQGLLRKVTTFEALNLPPPAGPDEDILAELKEQLTRTFAPPAGLLLCTPAVFDAWIEGEEKLAVLLAARDQRQAFWYWQEPR